MPKKLSTDEFIERARKLHGDTYDYSKVVYVNSKTKVEIVCKEHGSFFQIPNTHICNRAGGCPICGDDRSRLKNRTFSKEDFIEKAKKKHGDTYDYSRVDYVNSKTPVELICKKHGSFFQTPDSHYASGCRVCGNDRSSKARSTTYEDFLNTAYEVHGEKYDYSMVEYRNSRDKINIICPHHGLFKQSPCKHTSGRGCPSCSVKARSESNKKSFDEFMTMAKEAHGDRYVYQKDTYISYSEDMVIICKDHGEFLQKPKNHVVGKGCASCCRTDRNSFIAACTGVHGGTYNYDKVKYINVTTKVIVTCPAHGDFEILPYDHKRGNGCRECAYEANEGFYSFRNMKKNPELASKPASVYVAELMSKDSDEVFFKVGITTSEDVRARFRSIPYESIRTTKILEDDLATCLELEQLIINELKHSKLMYKPRKKFGGWTECYKTGSYFNDL